MVFSMISTADRGPLVKVKATVYKGILKKHIIPNLRTEINQSAIFTQDNVPCHTAKSIKTFLSEEDVTVMEGPAQSPDMNPIENVRKSLNERAKEKIQETPKKYGLIWMMNLRKYPLKNARH